jgi:hypothetical protein
MRTRNNKASCELSAFLVIKGMVNSIGSPCSSLFFAFRQIVNVRIRNAIFGLQYSHNINVVYRHSTEWAGGIIRANSNRR